MFNEALSPTKLSEYYELKEMYNLLINKLYLFLKELEINDPTSLYIIYHIMYRNGLISKNEFHGKNNEYLDLEGLFGIDILKGNGVCRHISSVLNDLAIEYGYDSRMLAIYIKTLKKDEENKRIKKAFKSKITPNHVINQISVEDKNYLFDPTNDLILKKGIGNRIINIHGNKTNMIYTPKIQQILNYCIEPVNNKTDFHMDKNMKLPTLTIDEIKYYYNEINNKFAKYQDTVKLFYFKNNNINLIEDIINLATIIKKEEKTSKQKVLIK